MTAGECFEVPYPFVRDTYVSHQDDEEGPSSIEVPTWKPGVRFEDEGYGDVEAYADAMGAQLLTVVSVHKPGRFPTRVFYTRQWRDPDGAVWGKGKLRMTTLPAFTTLRGGYRHRYELKTAVQATA